MADVQDVMEPILGPRRLREEELIAWGHRVGESIHPPVWMALVGPLGAGKSVFARAVCRGAGVTGHIPSPSFTLVQRYQSPRGFEIYHVDLFRLRPGDTMEPLGWDELVATHGLVLVEWADRAAEQQPEDRWDVEIEHGESAGERMVTVRRRGDAPKLLEW